MSDARQSSGVKGLGEMAVPAWVKHGLVKHGSAIVVMVALGAIAWNQLQNDVVKAADAAEKNRQSIEKLTESVTEINRRQGVIINNQENVREQMQRERAVQAERYNRTEKRLDSIIDTLNRRYQPGGGSR